MTCDIGTRPPCRCDTITARVVGLAAVLVPPPVPRAREWVWDACEEQTGARLTHDVKNLLQSLRSLCAAADTSSADEAAAFVSTLRAAEEIQ